MSRVHRIVVWLLVCSAGTASAQDLAVVSSGAFRFGPLSPGSIVTAFGENLSRSQPASASPAALIMLLFGWIRYAFSVNCNTSPISWPRLRGPLQVIVLLDSQEGPYHPDGRSANLVCYAEDGELLWRAELPSSGGGDCYYQFVSHDPIVVSSYDCTIDADTGRIVKTEFFK